MTWILGPHLPFYPGGILEADNALCRRIGTPDDWFPDERDLHGIEHAKTLCRQCPITQRCAEWAIQQRVPYGIFGGTTGDERRLINRRMRRNGEAA